jgi:hypothetical protein
VALNIMMGKPDSPMVVMVRSTRVAHPYKTDTGRTVDRKEKRPGGISAVVPTGDFLPENPQ